MQTRAPRLSPTTRLIGAASALLLAATAVSPAFLARDFERASEAQAAERANSIAALAHATNTHAQEMSRRPKNAPTNTLLGWSAAERAARSEGLGFKVITADGAPAAGAFETALLHDLRAQRGQNTITRVDRNTNTLHVMRAVTLDSSCMSCHAGDGQTAGAIVGAYDISVPLDGVQAQAAGIARSGLFLTIPAALVGVLGLSFVCRRCIAQARSSSSPDIAGSVGAPHRIAPEPVNTRRHPGSAGSRAA